MAGDKGETSEFRGFLKTQPPPENPEERELVVNKVEEIIRSEVGIEMVRWGVEHVYSELHPDALPINDDVLFHAVNKAALQSEPPTGFHLDQNMYEEIHRIVKQHGVPNLVIKSILWLVGEFLVGGNVKPHEEFVGDMVHHAISTERIQFYKQEDED